ncbi:MAG: 50S ribosomal protein L18 [Candidatus Marinimicrobia bacterium]|nr:50S ribosomal protein L18 [Candidatus Neomarinimicrobiota bacterium]MCF7851490.1 50S ribosomal protein L18 [Candidatus Neomarinimicrobiota bacterium]
MVKRLKKKKALRAKITGTPEVPRLVVFRSNRHISAQLINDQEHKVLMGTNDLSEAVQGLLKKDSTKLDASKAVGKTIAEKAKADGIKKVVFDRNGFKYHGRIKALADSARAEGLEF